MKNKVIVVTGPTASGKTKLAIELGRKFSGEIISADSRQVYKNLDIGTGKDRTYPHHLIDICDTNIRYTVAEYQVSANKIISALHQNKKIPILVGGTPLYIDAVIYGYQFPPEDRKIREKLEKLTTDNIIKKLILVDPVSAKRNKDNRRKLIRALEVYLLTSRPISSYERKTPAYSTLVLAIDVERKKLYRLIDDRVDARIKNGMIEEVKNLLKKGVSYKRLGELGLEYRFISKYLQNQLNKSEMIEKLKFAIHDFARRQLTWLRGNKNIIWIKNNKEAIKISKKFIEKNEK